MSVTITTPNNNSEFLWKTPVTFKGKAEGEIVKVEIFAEQYHLGSDDVKSGEWIVNYPGFNKPGLRKIRVVGFDEGGNKVDSTEIAIVASVNPNGFERGIDVSDHDGSVNWPQVRSAGFTYAFAKATEGRTWKADTFPKNWRQIQGAGIIRGAYHFFRPSVDPKEQARNFLDYVASVEPIQPEDLPPALDLEHFPDSVRREWESVSKPERVQRVRTWIDIVETEINRKPIIYTSFGFWDEFMSGVKDFSSYPLWVAHYPTNPTLNNPKPLIPREWKTWAFWQYSDTTEVPGIPADNEDSNLFNGSLGELLALVPSTIITT
ncbi:MAG: GH25 family lysozyme [Nostoc sp.]|uniref:glycoside hydrolase family 25 protein n=1 Tax=Nostoc sp. TaxID=1180 RepID=UPI002FFA4DA8